MITDYADLRSQVADHLDRVDLTDIIPTLIQLGESRLNRALRLKSMEQVDTGTISTNTDTIPTGFIETIAFHILDGTYSELRYMSGPNFVSTISSGTGKPSHYTVYGSTIEFNVTPDTTYTYRHHYIRALQIATDSTNWVLTNYPDAYLYSALAAAEPYLKNDERISLWDGLSKRAIDELNILSDRARDDSILIQENTAWSITNGA